MAQGQSIGYARTAPAGGARRRWAHEPVRNENVGEMVGYRIRFESKVSKSLASRC